MAKKINLSSPAEIRRKSGENQSVFWRRFGVTQSGGSRYESGRNMPGPLKLLMKALLSGALTIEQLEKLGKL